MVVSLSFLLYQSCKRCSADESRRSTLPSCHSIRTCSVSAVMMAPVCSQCGRPGPTISGQDTFFHVVKREEKAPFDYMSLAVFILLLFVEKKLSIFAMSFSTSSQKFFELLLWPLMGTQLHFTTLFVSTHYGRGIYLHVVLLWLA